jgi:hypothetical protein
MGGMPDYTHLEVLNLGVEDWNRWRVQNRHIRPHLAHADLTGRDLKRVNFKDCDLSHAVLRGAKLSKAQLSGADLSDAILDGARLRGAYLRSANLQRAKLRNCNLRYTNLAQADVAGADFGGAAVYGIAAWNIRGEPANQSGMLLNRSRETPSPVDNLELAQFLHLLLEHDKLRSMIIASTGKLVLLLGEFNDGGLKRLRALGDELKTHGYLPAIFDFERPPLQSYSDTVEILASLARFVVADLAGPSVAFELATLIPHHMIPFVLIRQTGRKVFSMAPDLSLRSWVLPPFEYADDGQLRQLVKLKIVDPAERVRSEYAERLAAAYKPPT